MVRRTQPNPYRLPDDHFIAWLAEAKQMFQHKLPPFVEKNQGSNRAGLRKNVTLRVTEDLQQGLPVEAEIICWSWSPYYTFCTIDIGGQRLIVKGNSFERYPSYRSWLGPEEGFSYQPVAFGPWQKDLEISEGPNIDLRTQHANHVRTLSNTPSFGSSAKSDGRADQASKKNHYVRQPEWSSPTPSSALPPILSSDYLARQQYTQEKQHYLATRHAAQAASVSFKDSPRPIQAKNRDVQASTPTVHDDSQQYVETSVEGALTSGPSNGTFPPKRHEEHPSQGPSEPVQASLSQDISEEYPEIQEDHGLTSKPNEDATIETQKQDFAPTSRTDERALSRQAYGNNTVARIAYGPQYQGQQSSDAISVNRTTKRKRQTSIPDPSTSTSPHLSTATHSQSTRSSPPPTPSTFSQNPSRSSTPTTFLNPQSTHHNPPPPPPPSSSPSLLAPHKQSHTTLFVAIPLSTDAVPLKLRSCMSLDSFFTAVLAISATPGQDNAVSGIRASFDWKGAGEKDRAILLKRDLEDSFEVFLEIVDAAPCWEVQGGRCAVGVEVVLV